jgi:two-component system sensor histidine kinase DctS
MSRKGLLLRHKITGLAAGLVLLATLFGGALMARSVARAVEAELGARAMSVARAVAQVEEVKANVGKPDGATVIQPIAERMRLATGMAYVVIFDMQRIRYSHLLEEYIGTRFDSGDEGPALAEQAYVSPAVGVNGPSVRAFVPVMSPDNKEQAGVVVVGLLVPGILNTLQRFRAELFLALIGSLGVGVLGAWVLAANIKRQMFDLEPAEIASSVEERVATFSAVTEALIAIDADCRITVMNEAARRMAGVTPDVDPLGMKVNDVIPDSHLPEVVKTGRSALNQQRLLRRTLIVSNRVPIYHQGRIIGAVATFRDRSEVTRMAEELTGVAQLVDSLRATNHESLNKLHTIAGLIQLNQGDEALDYIFNITERQQEIARFIARNVKEYRVAGLLLGKVNRARELDVTLAIDPQSRLDGMPAPLEGGDLVVIIGNLIENALEATLKVAPPRTVNCLVRGNDSGLEIRVADNGCGLPAGVDPERVFVQGYSTKQGPNRGVGLALVKQLAAFAGAHITLESRPGRTVITVAISGGVTAAGNQGAGRR